MNAHRLLVGCTALIVFGFHGWAIGEEPATKKKATPDTYRVPAASPLKITVTLPGIFEAGKMWPVVLHPETWSTFTVLKTVTHGKQVKKGDKLVWLDMTQIDQQIADTQQALKLSQLARQLNDAELRFLKETSSLDLAATSRSNAIADEDLKYYLKVGRPRAEQSARFSLKSAKQSLQYAMEELQQLEKMYKADDLTEETEEIVLTRARNDVERSEFMLKSTELRTQQTLKRELPRRDQQMKDAARRAALALLKAKATQPVQMKQKQLEREKQIVANKRLTKKLRDLLRDRKMMEVLAPADGFVYFGRCKRGKWSGIDSVATQLRRGGKLTPRSPFMTIVSRHSLRVRTILPEKELHHLRRGLKGIAVPTGYPDLELSATLESFPLFPIESGQFDGRVQVQLPKATARQIAPGMSCTLTFVVYEKKGAITVPPSAVFVDDSDGRRDVVRLKGSDGKTIERKIVIGHKTEKRWEVIKGLKPGDQLLLKKAT